MSAAKLRKILSLSFSLVIVLLFPLTIYASTATSSEAQPLGIHLVFSDNTAVKTHHMVRFFGQRRFPHYRQVYCACFISSP